MKTNVKKTTTKRTTKKGYDIEKLFHIAHQFIDEKKYAFHDPRGNGKIGKSIPAWNILPGITCASHACGHCLKEGCYALKNCLCHGYIPEYGKNNCLWAWTENTSLVYNDLAEFEGRMVTYLQKKKPQLFRIHASGDFFSVEYAETWYRIIKHFPKTKFLAFTKQWNVIREVPFYDLPNMSLVLSGWTGISIPEDLRKFYRCAWCDDGQETRIPADAIECPGNCENCGICWNLNTLEKDTYFHKH